MPTFDELFEEHRLSWQERVELVHHLAAYRYRRTIEELLPESLQALRGKPAGRAALEEHDG